MAFQSILFPHDAAVAGASEPPPFFRDLNLDQLVAGAVSMAKAYDLALLFHVWLTSEDAIVYRQAVMRDLERVEVHAVIDAFAIEMGRMRAYLDRSKKLDERYAIARGFLGAVNVYCEAVMQLARDLGDAPLESCGLRAFREYVAAYVASAGFRTLAADRTAALTALAGVRYALLVDGLTVTVRPDVDARDYAIGVEETFAKFRERSAQDYRVDVKDWGTLSTVDALILERVALLHPEPFRMLAAFADTHAHYVDAVLVRFEREVHLYIAYLTYIEPLRQAGLPFCYPRVSASKAVHAENTFDLALAARLHTEKTEVVLNDFSLGGQERIFVVSGPNQGGKTTFARAFGQIHYLASLGCPVPGTSASLFLFDRVFTHFEREESMTSLRGKLKDDLMRIRDIVDHATGNSIVILNEIFSSTTVKDAVFLSAKIMERLSALGVVGVWVTFLDELSTFNEQTVSIVSTVDPDDPAVRTFRLERRPADGLAHALAIAERRRVTYSALKDRLRP